jgi:aspartate carbamoyltransferase catalytic subunit
LNEINFTNRDINSIKDFTKKEINYILKSISKFESSTNNYSDLLHGKIMATLFFEPSTRTRLSFKTAMYKLGGNIIEITEPEMSSITKGETLADTIRVVEKYSDIIVLRHPMEGAAKFASEVANIPIINGGSGSEEHPTQALLDLYTILKEKGKIDGLNIGLMGDLRYGRAIHSLAYALQNYEIDLNLISPPILKMRRDIVSQLQKNLEVGEYNSIEEILPELDVLYVTRVQKERFPDLSEYMKVKGSYEINIELLRSAKENLIILHPLPRIDEIRFEVDSTPFAKYFDQSENGVVVRMALLSLILNNNK